MRRSTRGSKIVSTEEKLKELTDAGRSTNQRLNALIEIVDGFIRKPPPTVVVWLNLNSKQEVDELYHRWREAGRRRSFLGRRTNVAREFRVADLDGNQLRVFYDFAWELQQDPRR